MSLENVWKWVKNKSRCPLLGVKAVHSISAKVQKLVSQQTGQWWSHEKIKTTGNVSYCTSRLLLWTGGGFANEFPPSHQSEQVQLSVNVKQVDSFPGTEHPETQIRDEQGFSQGCNGSTHLLYSYCTAVTFLVFSIHFNLSFFPPS